MDRLPIRKTEVPSSKRLISAVLSRLPGAWMSPSPQDLVALYRMRYEMALEESKFDSALVFLNKILEVDPRNLEAKLQIGRIHHLHTREYSKAIAEYNKVIRLASDDAPIRNQARSSLSELIELVS